MKRDVTAAMLTAPAVAAMVAAGIASADPAVPQAGAACNSAPGSPGANNGAQTLTPRREVLICVSGDNAGMWQHLDELQRPVRNFFTYGPGIALTGGDVTAGEWWVGMAVFEGTTCAEAQTDGSGRPPVSQTNKSVYFDFELIPNLTTLTLSGHCNWVKVRGVGEPPPRA
jgi:hypothetical protein